MRPPLAHWLKVLGVGLAALLGLLVVPFLIVAFALPNEGALCGNTPLVELASPNGQLKAVVFARDCGATTSASTQVSVIVANGALPNEGGNLFAADTNHNSAPSGPGGGPAVQVTWVGPSALRIEHHPLVRVFSSRQSLNGVQVEYSVAHTDG